MTNDQIEIVLDLLSLWRTLKQWGLVGHGDFR